MTTVERYASAIHFHDPFVPTPPTWLASAMPGGLDEVVQLATRDQRRGQRSGDSVEDGQQVGLDDLGWRVQVK